MVWHYRDFGFNRFEFETSEGIIFPIQASLLISHLPQSSGFRIPVVI
jgi:hypothetical protein